MSVNRRGSRCWQLCLYVYTFFYWASGLFLIFLGIWMLIDPKRSYVLQLVHFSEDDPLLIFAAGMSIIVGAISCIVGFLAFCGANKRIRCVLGTFIVCAAVICISEIGIGTLALVFRNKFSNDRAPVYLSNLTHNHYSRDYWVRPLIDTIQFYLECCGGGNAARDYENSFWFVTNGERGTRSFVPQSCCKQAQAGRAWAIQPVDPLCSIYHYNTQAFRSAVNDVGCHDRLVKWLDEQTWIFAGVGFGFALFQMIGIIVSLLYCNSIHYYTLVV